MLRNATRSSLNHGVVCLSLTKPFRSYHGTIVNKLSFIRKGAVFDGFCIKSDCYSSVKLADSVGGIQSVPGSHRPRDFSRWNQGGGGKYGKNFDVCRVTFFFGRSEPLFRSQNEVGYQCRSYIPSWLRNPFRAKKKDPDVKEMDAFYQQKSSMFHKDLTEEEIKSLKIAFAEGYILGTKNAPKETKISFYSRLISGLFNIFIVIPIIIILVLILLRYVIKAALPMQLDIKAEKVNVTFEDVKGVDEAKQELQDVVSFLRNPKKFTVLGGKLPKGVLLVGPPGTGKTLLARAVAGEAGVPFFHAAGPEFDELFVGQGARRVRDLFQAAKKNSPCVVFIDEIDSVGAKRTNSVLHPYANQTINQLLSEMDGFHQNEGIIVLGATNRRDDLDKALLRPGRFDVEVFVPIPDYTGRKQILELYLKKILSVGVDVDKLARGTTGFTGADLENMVNQAALKAAIDGAEHVSMRYLENARDKVLMGPERKNRIPDNDTNLITAYHEAGHTLVAHFTKDAMPLHKVTIIPRGPSLGHTAYIPDKERYHTTKSQLLASMDTMMGGRAAEELVFGTDKVTSGASSDFKQATAIATHMVKEYGMSENVGVRYLEDGVLGDVAKSLVDEEITKLLDQSYERAKNILQEHSHELKLVSTALMMQETLDADDVKAILQGMEVKE